MKQFSYETRRKMSLSAKRRCDENWRKATSESRRIKIDDHRLLQLYDAGMSQSEVAAELGVSQKVVWRALRRLGVKCRKPVARCQQGENNNNWRGGNASYSAMHHRVQVARGKPSQCEICGSSNEHGVIYEWANLTGDYSNINDYSRMCRPLSR